jgi:hypothetical protein
MIWEIGCELMVDDADVNYGWYERKEEALEEEPHAHGHNYCFLVVLVRGDG